MLLFSEEVVLLLLDDEEGVFLPVGKNTLELALTGSVLMALAFADRIDTDLERLMVINRKPTDNPAIDRVLERIIGSEGNSNARALIATLSEDETATIQEHALAGLVQRGIPRREEKRFFQETIQHLWIFRSPRYFLIAGNARRELLARLTDVLFSDEIPDPRDVTLVGLVDACGILPALFPEEQVSTIAPRIEQLRRMDLIGREIASAIADVDRSNLEGLGPELEWVVLDEHEVLPLDGTQGDARYFVASGRLEIVHASSSVAAALAGSRMSGSSEPSVKRSCPSTSSAGSAWAR